ncbi:endolytic transglycosylase MltG [soil metagenome]
MNAVSNEPSWDEIFGGQPARPAQAAPASVEPVSEQFPTARLSDPFAVAAAEATATSAIPIQAQAAAQGGTATAVAEAPAAQPSRRELRDAPTRGRGRDSRGPRDPNGPKKRSKAWIGWLSAFVVFLLVVGGVGAYGWLHYEKQIRDILGIQLANDYDGSGNGNEVTVVIQSGDLGSDVAQTLVNSKVTMSFDAVYDYLLKHPDVGFEPGNYTLQEQMSAKSAVTALLDPANKVINKVTIPEGTAAVDAYVQLAAATGLTVDDFTAAAADPASYGLPAEATSLEGFLFPATYDFDPGVTAHDVLDRMVTETMSRLDDLGVAPERRWDVIRLASIIQREAGSNVDDMGKIGRVFQNRLDQGMRLQSDATVAYGTGNTHTVWTTDAERANAGNLYNTYANDGLPIGPIGLPGENAIEGALNPTPGAWLFFVPINLKTGETVFSETADQHEAAVAQLRAWCRESDENASYCA